MKHNKNLYILLMFTILLSACAPINRHTRLKRTPREHTLNYCGTDIKAPYTDYNKESWVVFSDRDNNDTYQNPGGKVKLKKMEFLEPFFVIKEKGDYLRLVKFNPEIVENNIYSRKIKDRKKAEYYGWVHRSRLLLTKQSSTDISTGFKNKALSIITDTTAVVEPEAFFETDSIWTYKDENLTVRNIKIPMHEIIFILKTSNDKNKVLVAKKTIVSPEEAVEDILGWISNSLVKEFGQRLFVDLNSLPGDMKGDIPAFKDKHKLQDISIPDETLEEISDFQEKTPAFRYNPVQAYCVDETMDVRFKTGIPAPVIDRKDNYVFNVNGNKIMYNDFKKVEKDLKKLNLMFVFEGKEQVLNNFQEILNVIQNLEPSIKNQGDRFNLKVGAVTAYQNKINRGTPVVRSVGLTNDYAELIDFLVDENENLNNYSPLATAQTWTGVRQAVNILEPHSNETNILVIIGEEGYSEWADSILVRRMADANCRIVGYQMYSEISNRGNNFVLQIENMIAHCGQRQGIAKKEKIIYTDQVKMQNRYRESSKNVYTLDFPEKSMTQGWVLFPEKSTEMPLDLLFTAVDSMVAQVKADNDTLIASMYRAFNEVGNSRYKYDNLWVNYNLKDSTWLLNKALPQQFSGELPNWYLSSQPLALAPSDRDVNYHLLLTNSELNELVEFMEQLCAYEPDYKYKGKKRKGRKLCNCPDDELYFQEINTDYMTDTQGNPEYLNTKRIRLHLYKLYLKELTSDKLCQVKMKELKKYPLAKAHLEITGSPTHDEMVNGFTIKDLKRKKYMTDLELDQLIQYYKVKKDQLVDHVRSSREDVFVSNGQLYYWIHRDLLP